MPTFFTQSTARGYQMGEVVSALQKSIRRGDEAQATWWAAELDQSGYAGYAWNRLQIICSEDVGPAWPEGPAVIGALHTMWEATAARKNQHRPERLFLTHAAMLLAQAPKSRRVDEAAWANYGTAGQYFDVPDYALDMHTARGRAMGRGEEHFDTEASVLVNETTWDDNPYLERYNVSSEEAWELQWGANAAKPRSGGAAKLFSFLLVAMGTWMAR